MKKKNGRFGDERVAISCKKFKPYQTVISLLLAQLWLLPASANLNSPPKFLLDKGSSEVGGDIVIRLKEGFETPPGTKIIQLRGFDPDGDQLLFGVKGRQANELIRIENHHNSEASVYLNQVLDAEAEDEYQVLLTLTDGHLGSGNFITQSMLILVEDINDNPPVFLPYAHTIHVEEHSGPQVIGSVEARDRDSGIFGQVFYELGRETEFEEIFRVETIQGRGVISVTSDLDFETKSGYQIQILARDRANFGQVNTATAAIFVKVRDIADQPPEFVSVPSVTRVPEDVPKFSEILRVKAIDGDRDIGNSIMYSIASGPADIFAINTDTGIVYTIKDLDRENEDLGNGAFILEIEAKEIGGIEEPKTRTEITVIIEDVNDETPKFRSSHYVAEINENALKGTPVHFVSEAFVPEVFDHDRGSNGTFQLYLEGDEYNIFEVSPKLGVNEASFTLRIRNSTPLDFETIRFVNFSVVARETVLINPKSSRVPVTVHIRDQNDNTLEFSHDKYQVKVPENIAKGETIAWIRASDLDSGLYGTSGIRFTRIIGPLAKNLSLDAKTGVVSTAGDSPFDREISNVHFLTIEARDELGRGNRNTLELQIDVTDVNDNPPIFRQDTYEIYLAENSEKFDSDFFIKAEDADEKGTDNAEVRYKLISGDANFTIHPVSGQIRPGAPVDFEQMQKSVENQDDERIFQLKVRAFDLGTPSLHSTVDVIVYVTDKNDHSPKFDRDLYQVSVKEDVSGGTNVMQVRAKDRDGSFPNNHISYRIQSGAKDKFVIDSDTGVIAISDGANLDPDLTVPKKYFYVMEVAALDGGIGTSKLSGTTFVNVSVIDVNNKNPIFDTKIKTVHVLENVNNGHFVTQVAATDLDKSATLRYSIDFATSQASDESGRVLTENDVNLSNLFELDSIDGNLRVVGLLDREVFENCILSIEVEDLGAEREAQIDTMSLSVVIDDENDNNPQFRQKFYRGSIVENSKSGVLVLRVSAQDPDKNRSIAYSLEGSENVLQLLKLNAKTGEISAGGERKIDHELVNWLNFTVRATDSGFLPRSSYVSVAVEVLDENDNNPIFKDDISNLTVSEATPRNSVIARLRATDLDSGEFGKVSYFLDRRSTSLGKFKIDAETGELSIYEELDREQEDVYNLVIQAYDNYQFGFMTGDSRSTFTQVTILVTDVNDEKPQFIENYRDGTCDFITEFHDVNEAILTVRATDRDDPHTENGRVKFYIQSGNDLDLFRIEAFGQTSARIFPKRQLKGYYGNYTLTVVAQDEGFPANREAATYGICVQDFNDNAPKFISPPANYTVRVGENATLGTEVIRVRAVDTDIGSNGEVRYRIRKDHQGNHRNFHIDPTTGIVTLIKPLDRERQKLYELRIEAFDLGIPTPLQTDLDLMIYVKNVNDHQPKFIIDQFSVNFTEHTAPGAERALLAATIDEDELDDDAEILHVCYFIVGGSDAKSDTPIFELLPEEHELILNRELDREEKDVYELIVQATEECFSPPEPTKEGRSFDSSDDSLLRVIVYVNDIDDNPPRFTKSVFTGGISTDIDFGTSFMRIKAQDPDEGPNAKLEYALDGEVIPSPLSEGLVGIRTPPFLVNGETGDIKLNFDPQKGMKGYFDFGVRVSDRAGHVDKAKVQIYLLREDQRVKFVMRSTPAELRSRIDKFLAVMSTQADAIVNTDGFKLHENPDGTIDKTKTDVLMHFVDPRDNSVMEASDILRLIDYRTEELNDIFKEFNVIYTEGVDPSFVKSASTETILVYWLFAICLFLAVMLILVLCLCYHMRKKYVLKLRAATTSAFGDASSDTILNKREIVPNTNRHATEGSNPIWMTGVGYENFNFEKEDREQEEEEKVIMDTRNKLHRYQLAEEALDSLDANILNDSLEGQFREQEEATYAASQISNGGSTIRVSSAKMDSTRSSSSGLGSALSRGRLNDLSKGGPNGIYNKSMAISALFPPQMPQVKLGNYGNTMYDEDDIPRTEL